MGEGEGERRGIGDGREERGWERGEGIGERRGGGIGDGR